MTADLREGLSDSRPRRPSSAKVPASVECHVEVPMAPDGRLKGGHLAEKEVYRGRQKVGDREKNGTGRERGIQLVKGRKVSLLRTREDGKDVTELIRRELDSQFPVEEPRTTESEDGEGREEEPEDNVEEGDGAVAQAASEKPVQESKAREQQHSLQEALGGWENFLSRRQLRVLLVEDDDSTRHVVGALLRNCNYEVTVAANGLKAWELLESVNCNFDLVLTDVVMPFMSGIGLLSKMIVREASKRIPVVMMSSYDSMDIVFRCLAKGAADFLVKPVRKNELKNLWQHVWRSCHSSSSSRSESGRQTGNSERPNSCGGSDVNNISGSNDGGGSNDGSDNGSSALNAQGGSDNGSGNQMQVRMQPVQIPRNNASLEAADGDEEGQGTSEQKDAISDQEMGHDLAMATQQPVSGELEKVQQQQEGLRRTEEDTACAMEEDGPTANGENRDGSSSSENASNEEVSEEAIDLINGISCQPHMVNVEQPGDSENCDDDLDQRGSSSPKKNTSGDSLPTLELSLKRPRSVTENDGSCDGSGDGSNDGADRRVIRHSGGSAFSRYSTGGTVIQQHHQPGDPVSMNGYQVANAHGTYNLSPGQLGATSAGPLCLRMGSGSSKGNVGDATTPPPSHPQTYQTRNGQDNGSSQGHDEYSHSCQIKDETLMPMAISMPPPGMLAYDGVSGAYAPTMHPMYYAHPGGPTWVPAPAQHMGDCGEPYNQSAAYQEQSSLPGNVGQAGQYSHHHSHHHNTQYHHHHHHHHSHGSQPSGATPQQEEQQQSVITPGSGAPRCGSSNMAFMVDGNNGQGGSSNGYGSNGNGNGSMNGSASGSNNGHSNGQSGLGATPVDNSGNCGGSGSEPGNLDGTSAGVCTEQVWFARREAALNKFRQKRKERCFEKKVRYQSRKRLAEQRPRVRGQFVRQAIYDPPSGDVE